MPTFADSRLRLWPDALPFLYVLGFVLLLLWRPFSDVNFVATTDVIATLSPLVAGVVSIVVSRRSTGPSRQAWLLVGAGCVSWGAGNAIWTYYEVVLGQETPFPSFADLGYLGAVPLLFAGILILTAPRERKVQIRSGLDAMAIVAAAGALSWHLVVRDTFASSELTSMEKVLSSLYPLGDLVLLFSLVVAVPRLKQGAGNIVVIVLTAGVAAFVIADSLFAYFTVKDVYSTGSLVDAGWVLGTALFGYAALLHYRLQPEYLEASSQASKPGLRQLVPIVMLPFLLAWLLLTDVRETISTAEGLPTYVFVIAYSVLVVVREAMNLVDSLELSNRLAILNIRLEAKADYLSDRLKQETQLANNDALTGVLNRRAVMVEIEQLLALPSLVEEVGAIGMVDVDGLKIVNDTEGHSAGDDLLRRVASALSLDGAIVGRVGGDEFVIALPGATEMQVQAYLALVDWRLQSTANAESASPGGFSAGFAYFPAESKSSRRLMTLADERMYTQKQLKSPGGDSSRRIA